MQKPQKAVDDRTEADRMRCPYYVCEKRIQTVLKLPLERNPPRRGGRELILRIPHHECAARDRIHHFILAEGENDEIADSAGLFARCIRRANRVSQVLNERDLVLRTQGLDALYVARQTKRILHNDRFYRWVGRERLTERVRREIEGRFGNIKIVARAAAFLHRLIDSPARESVYCDGPIPRNGLEREAQGLAPLIGEDRFAAVTRFEVFGEFFLMCSATHSEEYSRRGGKCMIGAERIKNVHTDESASVMRPATCSECVMCGECRASGMTTILESRMPACITLPAESGVVLSCAPQMMRVGHCILCKTSERSTERRSAIVFCISGVALR